MVEKEMRWKADVKLEAGDAWNGDVQRDCPGVDTDKRTYVCHVHIDLNLSVYSNK